MNLRDKEKLKVMVDDLFDTLRKDYRSCKFAPRIHDELTDVFTKAIKKIDGFNSKQILDLTMASVGKFASQHVAAAIATHLWKEDQLEDHEEIDDYVAHFMNAFYINLRRDLRKGIEGAEHLSTGDDE